MALIRKASGVTTTNTSGFRLKVLLLPLYCSAAQVSKNTYSSTNRYGNTAGLI